MYDVRGALDAPMTLGGSYRYPEIETTVAGDAVVLPLLGEVRAAASVVADTRSADITAIEIRRSTAAITGDVRADITNRAWSGDRKSTRLNSSHLVISYAVFCFNIKKFR